jgi:hypothetical protein
MHTLCKHVDMPHSEPEGDRSRNMHIPSHLAHMLDLHFATKHIEELEKLIQWTREVLIGVLGTNANAHSRPSSLRVAKSSS